MGRQVPGHRFDSKKSQLHTTSMKSRKIGLSIIIMEVLPCPHAVQAVALITSSLDIMAARYAASPVLLPVRRQDRQEHSVVPRLVLL